MAQVLAHKKFVSQATIFSMIARYTINNFLNLR